MELRNYQKAAVAALFRYFTENKTGNPLIVCPTASGKSVIQAAFIKEAFRFPNQRWLLLSHVMELIDQNHERLLQYWPNAPAGIYCAKLKRKETDKPITVASIQSIYKKASAFTFMHGIIIDEAHLLSNDNTSMYRAFIDELATYNPKIKVIGMTATPYRLTSGLLTVGAKRLFTDIAYEIPITLLLKDGYIVNLRSKQPKTQVDLTGIKITQGDYNLPEMEKRFTSEEITDKALDEVFLLSQNRRSWLFFCSGVDHAFYVRDKLRERGVTAETITGDTAEDERKQILTDFRAGKIKAVTNMAVLTTGMDAPNIDNLILLRGTKSPGLYTQILGRGMRLLGRTLAESIANGKPDCQVLDFAGNIEYHGPINLIRIDNEQKGTSKSPTITKPPLKQCPNCFEMVHAASVLCPDCKHEFPKPEVKHAVSAASGLIIADVQHDLKVLNVDRVDYTRHKKTGKPDSLKVTYFCGLNTISEWVCLEHPGNAAGMARLWWRDHAIDKYKDEPRTITEALDRLSDLKEPHAINTMLEDGKLKILSVQSYKENALRGG